MSSICVIAISGLDKVNYSYLYDGCIKCCGTARVYDVPICIINTGIVKYGMRLK